MGTVPVPVVNNTYFFILMAKANTRVKVVSGEIKSLFLKSIVFESSILSPVLVF
jgi:hypothetical protein